jgi:hypothetical protein
MRQAVVHCPIASLEEALRRKLTGAADPGGPRQIRGETGEEERGFAGLRDASGGWRPCPTRFPFASG